MTLPLRILAALAIVLAVVALLIIGLPIMLFCWAIDLIAPRRCVTVREWQPQPRHNPNPPARRPTAARGLYPSRVRYGDEPAWN